MKVTLEWSEFTRRLRKKFVELRSRLITNLNLFLVLWIYFDFSSRLIYPNYTRMWKTYISNHVVLNKLNFSVKKNDFTWYLISSCVFMQSTLRNLGQLLQGKTNNWLQPHLWLLQREINRSKQIKLNLRLIDGNVCIPFEKISFEVFNHSASAIHTISKMERIPSIEFHVSVCKN